MGSEYVDPTKPKDEKIEYLKTTNAFSIQGRLYRERERLFGMTPEERAWRKQWVKDQILSPNEPLEKIPGYYEARYNPIRRFYMYPLNKVHDWLVPVIGKKPAYVIRLTVGKTFLAMVVVWTFFYQVKYNPQDWTTKKGWGVTKTQPKVVPGDPGYPYVSHRKTGADYFDNDRGFKNCPL